MVEMAGKTTNCARFCEQMLDAASASLSGRILAAFDAHLRDCAVCRDEFRRVQTLVQKIDRTLSVSLTAEPSDRLVANVRQSIRQSVSARPHGAAAWRRWSAWATAAGVCAAFAILLFVARTSRKFNRPTHDSAAVHTSGSSTSKVNAHPRLNAGTEIAATQPRKSALALVRRASLRTSHAKAGEPEITMPEVIVEPGQMQAILQLVAEAQRDDINEANLLNSETKATLEIKPIVIAPLKISALEDELEPSTSSGGFDGGKSSLSSQSK